MTNEYSEAISEALEVLQYLEDEFLNKIPLDAIKKLKERKSTSYINKFDETKEVDPSKLSEKARAVLAVLYVDYIADEYERKEFYKILDGKEIQRNNQTNVKPLFEKQENRGGDFLPVVVVKKNFIQKIFEKIFKTNKKSE